MPLAPTPTSRVAGSVGCWAKLTISAREPRPVLRFWKWVASSGEQGVDCWLTPSSGAPQATVVAEVEQGLGGCGEGGDGVLRGRDHGRGGASVDGVGGVAEGASGGERAAVEVDGADVEEGVWR